MTIPAPAFLQAIEQVKLLFDEELSGKIISLLEQMDDVSQEVFVRFLLSEDVEVVEAILSRYDRIKEVAAKEPQKAVEIIEAAAEQFINEE